MMTTLMFVSVLGLSALRAQTGGGAQTLLWKISGKGLTQESYFLITTSNTCEAKVVFSDKLKAALGKVKQIVMESGATNRANESKTQQLILAKNDNQASKNVLSAAVYKQLLQKAEDMGISELYLNQYTTFFISNRLMVQDIECSLPAVDRMEDELREYAKKNSLPVGELLSIEETYALYDVYPNQFWERNISFLLNTPDKVKSSLNIKAGFYKQENWAGLKQIFIRSDFFSIRYAFSSNETSRMLLLFGRIEKVIKDQPSMITLDASEVANDATSIFTLLTNSGYTLTPVTN